MKTSLFALLMAVTIGLTACQTDQWGNKQSWGTGMGALFGGLAGSQVGNGSGRLWATGAGVLLGAMAGGEVGLSLDRADRAYMQQAQTHALDAPVGEAITWNNPQSGNMGSYTPVRDGQTASGGYCREYQQKVMVGGKEQSAYGTACQQPDGSWQIVKG